MQWLAVEQQRWGIENRTHHALDFPHREDESQVRENNIRHKSRQDAKPGMPTILKLRIAVLCIHTGPATGAGAQFVASVGAERGALVEETPPCSDKRHGLNSDVEFGRRRPCG